MPRVFKHLEAGCLQVNLMSTSAQINQLKYTILYYTNACMHSGLQMLEQHQRVFEVSPRASYSFTHGSFPTSLSPTHFPKC